MKNKLKKAIFIGILSQVICIALLLSITFSKYTQEILGYSGFSVERFNAAILPVVTEEDSLEVTWTTQDFFPGMTLDTDNAQNDTSARTAFRVANGNNELDATALSLQYSVRIRTSQSLPLKYTLNYGEAYYSTLENPEAVTVTGYTDQRYEYMFGDASGNEAVFILEKGENDGSFYSNLHELIAEWPYGNEADTNGNASIAYMKEVEVVEIVVIVTTVNDTENPETGSENKDYRSDGIIFITPPQDLSASNLYDYTIDLRAFYPIEGEDVSTGKGMFEFTIDNAVGQGKKHSVNQITYTMQLKVPAELIDEEYSFALHTKEDTAMATPLESSIAAYRIYNEKIPTEEEPQDFKTLEEATAFLTEEKASEGYRLYYIYDVYITENNVLNNFVTDSNNNLVPYRDYNGYTLTINTLNGINDSPNNNSLVFLNKLEVLVEATFGSASGGGE